MDSVDASHRIYCFGCHVLDLNRAILLGPGGAEISLRPKAFDVLRFLVENAGRVVGRGELLDAVWPGLHVNDDGITQCVREVRRALGDETQQLVRTVAKRGYMLVTPVMPPDVSRTEADGADAMHPSDPDWSKAAPLPDLSVAAAPRLSFVVLPFVNLGGMPDEDYLADAVTDDLTSDLSRLDGAFVIGRGSAQVYRGRLADARRIGPALGVRYVVQGTVRRAGSDRVRISAELVSTENGASLWSDRFEHDMEDLPAGQDNVARRLGNALGVRLINIESERSLRERPDNPDAFDLLLRARSIRMFTIERARAAQRLLEQALALSPDFVPVQVSLAFCLMSQNDDRLCQWDHARTSQALALLDRAESLRAEAIEVIALRGAMLLWQGRYAEGSDVYQHVLTLDSNYTSAYHQIGAAKLWTGDPEGALTFYREALRRDPIGPSAAFRYAVIGYALLMAKRPEEAVEWLERSLRENPARHEPSARRDRAFLTSALALSGKLEKATVQAAELAQLAPTWTARSWDMRQWQSPPLSEKLRYVSEGLRLAGLRDLPMRRSLTVCQKPPSCMKTRLARHRCKRRTLSHCIRATCSV